MRNLFSYISHSFLLEMLQETKEKKKAATLKREGSKEKKKLVFEVFIKLKIFVFVGKVHVLLHV